MVGAALLAGEAALRSGAGRLIAAMPRSVYPIFTAALPEAVCLPLSETPSGGIAREALPTLRRAWTDATVLLCGCGIGTDAEAEEVLLRLLPDAPCPVILDADGINLMARHIDVLKTVPHLCLTPHPAEAARLLGCTTAEVQAARFEAANALRVQTGATVLLKGHKSLLATPDAMYINPTGNAGMATGGSGDVLAGMIASLAAQGMTLPDAAMCGAYLHGQAGDLVARDLSQHAMLPSDIIRRLGELFSVFE